MVSPFSPVPPDSVFSGFGQTPVNCLAYSILPWEVERGRYPRLSSTVINTEFFGGGKKTNKGVILSAVEGPLLLA